MFESVDSTLNLPQLEEKVLERWRKEKTFARVQQKNKTGKPFVFFEGPPTANAGPGIHHVEARAFKDLIPRYQSMKGRKVDRKAGWDTHGLPVELQVEKKLGLKNKKDIEAYGIEKFNAECRRDVWAFKQDWEKLTERIGFWLDMEHPYITYENEYIESVWSVLKRASERELLYQGHKVVPFCTRCGTGLSSHEVAQGYKVVQDTSAYVTFRLSKNGLLDIQKRMTNDALRTMNDGAVYIIAWTTTPWTLPGNVALAVGQNIEYVMVETKGELYILAKDRLETLHPSPYTLQATLKGFDLIGLQYEPLFPGVIKDNGNAFKIYAADFVNTTEGTGIVHTAVMYGEDDYTLGLEVGLPTEHSVGEDGRFLPHVTEALAGTYVKDPETEKLILNSLEGRRLLLSTKPYTHDYPFCWRCDTPLLYYARSSWFIRMSALREELMAANNSVNWEPTSIRQGRMGEWLENVKDWAISRERYWGTPLPFWQCDQGHLTVVGSVAELEKLGAQASSDLHRPFIDTVTFNCPQCGHVTKRVVQVADVWLDSGSMPFAQWGYPNISDSRALLREHYPADFIAEAVDQTRGWFYTLLAVASIVGQPAPYKNVICLGHVLDTHGKKMSKSKGNIVDPWQMLDAYGADALRFYFYSVNAAGEPKLFAEKDLQTVQRRVLLLWWNVYSFFVTYANQADWKPESSPTTLKLRGAGKLSVLDAWIESRLDQVTSMVTDALESYDALTASRGLADFINDLSTWYLRRSRSRFSEMADKEDQGHAFSTMYRVLVTLSRLMAPFTPFLSDAMYQNLTGMSVHLSDWPKAGDIDTKLIDDMEVVRAVVSNGQQARMEAGVKVRQPLRHLIASSRAIDSKDWDMYSHMIMDELNVREVDFQSIDRRASLKKSDGRYIEVGLGEETVLLDTTVTPELKREGLSRELTRAIQGLRKDSGFSVSDRAAITWSSSDDAVKQLLLDKSVLESISVSTRSNITHVADGGGITIDLNGHGIIIDLKPVQ